MNAVSSITEQACNHQLIRSMVDQTTAKIYAKKLMDAIILHGEAIKPRHEECVFSSEEKEIKWQSQLEYREVHTAVELQVVI